MKVDINAACTTFAVIVTQCWLESGTLKQTQIACQSTSTDVIKLLKTEGGETFPLVYTLVVYVHTVVV